MLSQFNSQKKYQLTLKRTVPRVGPELDPIDYIGEKSESSKLEKLKSVEIASKKPLKSEFL